MKLRLIRSMHLAHRVRFAVAALLAGACASLAHAGYVRTLDGQCLQGEVSLSPEGVVVRTAEGQPRTIKLSDLLTAAIRPPVAPSSDGYLGDLSQQEIGNASKSQVVFSRGLYAWQGPAADGWSARRDDFHFLSRGIHGDGEVVARLDQLSGATAGITLRASTKPDTAHLTLTVESSGALSLHFRIRDGQHATTRNLGKVALPLFLRLTRIEDQFEASTSADGANWEQRAILPPQDGTGSPLLVMPPGLVAGLVLAGHAAPAQALFERAFIHEDRAPAPAPPPPPVTAYRPHPYEALLKGILFTNGTFLANADLGFSSQGPQVIIAGKTHPIGAGQIARFQKMPLSQTAASQLPSNPGLLLSSGDYLEGTITAFSAESFEVNNILLGLSPFAPSQVQAVYLRNPESPPPGFSVHLVDGAVLSTTTLTIDPSGDLLTGEPLLERIPLRQVLTIQRTAASVISLSALPMTVQGPAGVLAEGLTCFDRTSGLWLSAGGILWEKGIVLPANAGLACRVPPAARRFDAFVALPAQLPTPPQAEVRFVIRADGKELFRSPLLTSQTPPLPVSLPLEHAGTLSLRVEAVRAGDFPVYGIWLDPLFH